MAAFHVLLNISVICALLWLRLVQSDNAECAKESGFNSDLMIKLIRYENPNAALANGQPCSIVSLSPNSKKRRCNAVFRFEVSRDSNDGVKNLNYQQTNSYTIGDTPPDQKFVKFSSAIATMRNPIVCEVEMQDLMHLFLKVIVEHHGSSQQRQLMDIFVLQLEPLKTKHIRSLQGSANGHILQVNYQFNCKANRFGPRCEKYCAGSDDDTNGHYRCSTDGEKVCLDGWTNVNGDCKIPAWCLWC